MTSIESLLCTIGKQGKVELRDGGLIHTLCRGHPGSNVMSSRIGCLYFLRHCALRVAQRKKHLLCWLCCPLPVTGALLSAGWHGAVWPSRGAVEAEPCLSWQGEAGEEQDKEDSQHEHRLEVSLPHSPPPTPHPLPSLFRKGDLDLTKLRYRFRQVDEGDDVLHSNIIALVRTRHQPTSRRPA